MPGKCASHWEKRFVFGRFLLLQVVVLKDPESECDDILRRNRSREKRYAFDQVFGETSSQEMVFNSTSKFLLPAVLNGYNATVFAYGPTGTGKTYTMCVCSHPSDAQAWHGQAARDHASDATRDVQHDGHTALNGCGV